MSLKTILHSILTFVSHIWATLTAEEKKFVHIGVTVTEAIKNFDAKSPGVADFITTLIPGTIDDEIKSKLRSYIPEALTEMKLIDSSTTGEEFLKNNLRAIKDLTGIDLALKLDEFAKRITDKVSGGTITWDQLAFLPKYYYDHEFNKD